MRLGVVFPDEVAVDGLQLDGALGAVSIEYGDVDGANQLLVGGGVVEERLL